MPDTNIDFPGYGYIPIRDLLINNIRRYFVFKEFEKNQRKRAFILIAEFPFMIIGKIVEVMGDYVSVDVETTHISEIEGKVLRIHVNDIEVFHIEQPDSPIPVISNVENENYTK
ncbi:MAG: hypothetical protein PWQ96_347 [Clostridia bacterium]|nr:hypothetical protein [Clostridia bacterium]